MTTRQEALTDEQCDDGSTNRVPPLVFSNLDVDECNVSGATTSVNPDIDRHHGWYTEFLHLQKIPSRRIRHATEFEVRTRLSEVAESQLRASNAKKVVLILRFKSLLRHKQSQAKLTKNHRDRSSVVRFARVSKPTDANSRNQLPLTLKRSCSDTHLQHFGCRTHLKLMGLEYDKMVETSRNILKERPLSLSTGNICCLYTLRCLPSIEFLQDSSTVVSPRDRCHSLPVSSLKTHARKVESHSLGLLKDNSFYRDTNVNLKSWLRHAMEHISDTEVYSISDDDDGNIGGDDLSKHVRFADESPRSGSLTTLNSISANSSLLSLSSLAHGNLQAIYAVTQATSSQNRLDIPRNSYTRDDHSKMGKRTKFVSIIGHSAPITDAILRQEQRFHPNSMVNKSRKHSSTNRSTPFITVNVIRDTSEPPEIPSRILKQLSIAKHEPCWRNLYPNPSGCTTFRQRLASQRVCLASLSSTNLDKLDIEVHVVNPTPFVGSKPSDVRLRCTLDHWHTFNDTCPLKKVHVERQQLTDFESEWVEIHKDLIDLAKTLPSEFAQISSNGRLEFAVVARFAGKEFWDNNNTENYTCVFQLDAT